MVINGKKFQNWEVRDWAYIKLTSHVANYF